MGLLLFLFGFWSPIMADSFSEGRGYTVRTGGDLWSRATDSWTFSSSRSNASATSAGGSRRHFHGGDAGFVGSYRQLTTAASPTFSPAEFVALTLSLLFQIFSASDFFVLLVLLFRCCLSANEPPFLLKRIFPSFSFFYSLKWWIRESKTCSGNFLSHIVFLYLYLAGQCGSFNSSSAANELNAVRFWIILWPIWIPF